MPGQNQHFHPRSSCVSSSPWHRVVSRAQTTFLEPRRMGTGDGQATLGQSHPLSPTYPALEAARAAEPGTRQMLSPTPRPAGTSPRSRLIAAGSDFSHSFSLHVQDLAPRLRPWGASSSEGGRSPLVRSLKEGSEAAAVVERLRYFSGNVLRIWPVSGEWKRSSLKGIAEVFRRRRSSLEDAAD